MHKACRLKKFRAGAIDDWDSIHAVLIALAYCFLYEISLSLMTMQAPMV